MHANDYSPVSGIEILRKGDGDTDGDGKAGTQFTYASGVTSRTYGHEDNCKYPSASFTLAPGELVKNAILYGNGKGYWLGQIHLETTKQTFDAGHDTNDLDAYGDNVGTFLLYGANVVTSSSDKCTGDDMQSLGLLFLKESIDPIAITDVTYDSDPQGS